MRRWCIVTLAVALAGCPYVPEGEIRGQREVALGESTQLRLYCDQLFGGWERVPCTRDWQASAGTITSCGLYTAPTVLPLDPVEIDATECDPGDGCADACGASTTITLVEPL